MKQTMSSREIAELTGKQHQHVKRDIEQMLAELGEDVSKFGRIYRDSMNREQTEYHLNRELTECLLTGYSASARLKVIRRWHELERRQSIPQRMKPLTERLHYNKNLYCRPGYWLMAELSIGEAGRDITYKGGDIDNLKGLDISMGLCFMKWLRKQDSLAHFLHQIIKTPFDWTDGRGLVEVNLYPDDLLPAAKRWYREVYAQSQMPKYLSSSAPQLTTVARAIQIQYKS